MKRALKIIGLVVVGIVLLAGVAGMFFRPKSHRVVTPSGRAYDLLDDLVSSDGQYFMRYRSPSSDLEQLESGARDLLALITSDPRAGSLRTITIEGSVGLAFGPFSVSREYGYVYEKRDGKWVQADERTVHDSMVGGGAIEAGSSHR